MSDFAENFQRFTRPAKEVVKLSIERASCTESDEPDTLHVLESMLYVDRTIAQSTLQRFEVSETAIDEFRLNESRNTDIKLIQLRNAALRQANALNHTYPGTEHLLLAICCERSSRGFDFLENASSIRIEVCRDVIDTLGFSWRKWIKTFGSES